MSEKLIVWAPRTKESLQTPPLSAEARRSIGYLLGQIQQGQEPDRNSCRDYKPAFDIGSGCYQLGLDDKESSKSWRFIYWVSDDAIYMLEVYEKRQQKRPKLVTDRCKARLSQVQQIIRENS